MRDYLAFGKTDFIILHSIFQTLGEGLRNITWLINKNGGGKQNLWRFPYFLRFTIKCSILKTWWRNRVTNIQP